MICRTFGDAWWVSHWWIVAVTVGTLLLLDEVAWLVHAVCFDKSVMVRADKQTLADADVHAVLLNDESEQSQSEASMSYGMHI